MIRKVIFSLIFLCLSGFSIFGQGTGVGNSDNQNTASSLEKYSAPVKWQQYKISDKEVSILLPKQPILIRSGSSCSEKEENIYSAYAEEVVYTLTITSKNKEKASKFCTETEKFDENSFENRLSEIKKSLESVEPTKLNQNGREFIKIEGKFNEHWFLNDYKNKRWFELQITRRENIEAKTKDFIDSLRFDKKPSGIEIGNGSNQTLGDIVNSKENNKNSKKEDSIGILLIHKPRANYTEAARQSQIQGTVTLRVAFLSNGGIGSVSPVNALPNGLTEQAIAAAKKIVFIPARKNGTTISITKIVQYSFTIY